MISNSRFMVIPNSNVALPFIGYGYENGIVAFRDIVFDLPDNTDGQGALSFLFDTSRGDDDGIDLLFSIQAQGYAWSFSYRFDTGYTTLVVPVGLKPGRNSFRFTLDKGGSIRGTHHTSNLGGKGRVSFAGMVVWYNLGRPKAKLKPIHKKID